MPDDPKPQVFMAMPHYGAVEIEAAKAFWCDAATDQIDTFCANLSSSLLAHAFNQLWCVALNLQRKQPVDYFVMLHADIVPERYWVDKLVAEMVRTKADLISCVVPIKSKEGVTSTAIDSPDPWEVQRRLTMREVMQLPETFSAADCGFPGRALLVNSGCWIADMRKLWVNDVRFQICNAIERGPDGDSYAKVMSEDWDFSRQVAAKGGKILATRKVSLSHIGPNAYGNQNPWGSYEMDHMAKGEKLPGLTAALAG